MALRKGSLKLNSPAHPVADPFPGMDRPPVSAGIGTAPAPAPVVRPVAAPAAPPALPPLLPGSTIEATVLEAGLGRARLSWQGVLFEAIADLPLQPGRTYDLLVTALQPQLTLSLGRALPDAAIVRNSGQLGSDAWLAPLAALLSLEAGERPDAPSQRPAPDLLPSGRHPLEFRHALAAWAAGKGTAADLATIHRLLGHDQEARVLRLPPPSEVPSLEVADLSRTQKALALRILDEPAQPSSRARAARELVTGLGQIERDNAERRDQGAPLWLPLPAVPEQGLRDARMFLWPMRGDGAGPDVEGEAAFHVVLLLDLTRLGELRVDVVQRGERIDATFTAIAPATVQRLFAALPELHAAMNQGGLQVGDLRVQPAPGDRLPVSDLVLRRSDDALVDVHA
jgi:hypothetical protein